MPGLESNQRAQAPGQVGFVKDCEICKHTSRHGPRTVVDTNDPRFNRVVPGTEIPLIKCQVPIRVPVGNGIVMGMPCGCDGVTGLSEARAKNAKEAADRAAYEAAHPKPAYIEPVVEERAMCLFPGCDEPMLATSSFCSQAHLDAMTEMLANFGKEKA